MAQDMDAAGLARSQGQALRALAPVSAREGNQGPTFRRAEAFLLDVLVHLEAGRRRRGEAHHGRALLRRTTAALARAERDLRVARGRTAQAEAALAKGVKYHRWLLDWSVLTQEQLRRMTRRVLLAQEEERKRISRELHDEVAQVLLGINVQLSLLMAAPTIDDRGARRRLAQAQHLVERSMAVVHRFARELRPPLLDDLGLAPALRSFVRQHRQRHALKVTFRADDDADALDNAARVALYRVAQEGLANVVRHAKATSVVLTLTRASRDVVLTVRDNGKGFDVQGVLGSRRRKRLGLLGMRERIEMVGGVLAVESAPGEGTTLRAAVPGRKSRATIAP